MSDDQTTLSEFDDGDGGDPATAAGDDPPTPAENAADIERLVDLVGSLSDQIGTITDELEQREPTDSIDTKPTDDPRMYQ